MTIAVGDTRFRGPYSRIDMLEHRAGVWAVMDGRDPPPLAAGASEDVLQAVKDHPSRSCWSRRCRQPSVAVFYAPLADQRERVLRALRSRYELPCLADGTTMPAPRPEEADVRRLVPRHGADPAPAARGVARAPAAS